MKVWTGYGSEHSMNLVMIGRFETVQTAEKAEGVIDRITTEVNSEPDRYHSDAVPEGRRFTDTMFELLRETNTLSIGAAELEQFAYDVSVRREGSNVIITTDEIEVSAFLKVLIDHGARVEVYSAHKYRGTGHGRGQ